MYVHINSSWDKGGKGEREECEGKGIGLVLGSRYYIFKQEMCNKRSSQNMLFVNKPH
jgi:hypothetical protein